MDPAFWTALPSIIAAVMAGITAIIATKGNFKIDANTKVTVDSKQEVVDKMDSTTKTVKQDAMLAARVATQANVKVLDKIEATLNGGPGGFTELTARVASLESRYDVLAQGHIDIKASIDRMTDVVKKQSNF